MLGMLIIEDAGLSGRLTAPCLLAVDWQVNFLRPVG
jgi:hypothetical protein